MNKLCFVATIPEVVNAFLRTHIAVLSQSWQITVVCHPLNSALLADLDIRVIPLTFERKAAPLRDLVSLWRLYWIFRREQFDLVHSIMPKTGLLTMLAARVAGVPHRLHTFTGQVWSNAAGGRRKMLRMLDVSIAGLATRVIVDSPSQRQFLLDEHVLRPGQGMVIGSGSICGVDIHRFRPDSDKRLIVRNELHIDDTQQVILYVGRMTKDKGLAELFQAFVRMVSNGQDLVLLLVGPEEDVKFSEAQQLLHPYETRLRCLGYTMTPERYMQASDIFCLPSYREGFGQVIIEAAACAVPAVASRIYGVTDAVAENETGLLFPPGDTQQLESMLLSLIKDPVRRQAMGESARRRAIARFSSNLIAEAMQKMYMELMRNRQA